MSPKRTTLWKAFALLTAMALTGSTVFVAYKVYTVRAYDWLSWQHVTLGDAVDPSLKHLFVTIVDHWEPGRRVEAGKRWLESYRAIAHKHRDADGRILQLTWAYPFDLREPALLQELSRAAFDGYGEIEAHWHHHHDNPQAFEADLVRALSDFNKYGALIHSGSTSPRFVFVHGNWALDNSIPNRCGINNELEILARHGAYADMTFPAIGTTAQPTRTNEIYRITDTESPKSYEMGIPVVAGVEGSGLMMVQGPLGVDLINPLILYEYGALDDQELTGFSGFVNRMLGRTHPWRHHRARNWLNLAPRVKGKDDWAFLKLHTHGIEHSPFIFELVDAAIASLLAEARARDIQVHFVSAREMYNLIRAVEMNQIDEPRLLYDYEIGKPLNKLSPFWTQSAHTEE